MTQQTSSCLTTDGFSLPYTTITAKQDDVKGVIVYYHGGGLIFGQPNDFRTGIY
ncbi:esterase/lipase-protein [Staphylococcus gallinarum]|uniref:Esterase/lipase-protein n=1 Tax=Staphylococcus gallinarum TaxID=1293 RepID=A0A380FD40_STAGA|nr:esterase/lipase-protein [Staphylococcus gallinarum]